VDNSKKNLYLLNKAPDENPDPVLIMSIDGTVIYHNPATRKYLNYVFPKTKTNEIISILPLEIKLTLETMKKSKLHHQYIDYEVGDIFLKCKVVQSCEKDFFHLYITNMTYIKNATFFDIVTGLPNTIYFNKIIEKEIIKCKKTGTFFSVIIFDINNYKNLNYSLGYQFGEKLLISVSQKLKTIFTDGEIISKYSDHDYAILLQQVSLRSARVRADNVIEVFASPVLISDLRIEIDACIGIAEYPRHGADAHLVLQCANIAMHKAQKMNSSIETYDKFFFEETTRKIQLATDLHRALGANELSVMYQPKVDLNSNTVIGVEALMRWLHPKEGFISPEVFIEVAEQSRLIREITLWILNRTLKDYAQLSAVAPNIQLSVNITARDLTSETFPEVIAGLLAAWKIPANVLILEITENALITDTELVLSIMSRLSYIGVKLSIDDFGTGYSSFNYLRQLNVNELKIDKSFVMDMLDDENDRIIVRAVTSLAHDLKLKVTAEGVESNEIMEELKKLKCDIAQGYYLSKPIKLKEIVRWIKNYS